MRIVVITSCTGEKQHKLDTQLTQRDFERLHDVEWFSRREAELAEFRLPAQEMYTGQQHVRLMRGVNSARETAGEDSVDLWILSAGYGLIPADSQIVPYECTFKGMRKPVLRAWAEHLDVPAAARKVLVKPYDFGLILLGDDYLEASGLPHDIELGGPTLAFVGARQLKKLSGIQNLLLAKVSNPEAKRFSCGLVALKGELGARVLSTLAQAPATLKQLCDPNTDILSMLDVVGPAAKKKRAAARPNPAVDVVISIPQSWWQKPHRDKLMYFIPEWDDLVDPDYNFETDTHSGGSGDWSNEVYAHQMYPEPNYDGILISKVVAEKSKKKKARINEMGVHRYLRVPREFPIMGDCGAFGYIKEEVPPYTTGEILNYYTRLDFDFGVSVDHLIVASTETQKKHRYELTINNAEEFLVEHRKRGLGWTPVGAVQGWDPASYAEAARQYVAMGYRYIGLGGLVRSTTPDVFRVLSEVRAVVPPEVKVHVFGFARFNALREFLEAGLSSIDSASMLRKAWLGSDLNFLALNGWYSAIRVPQAEGSFRAKRLVEGGEVTLHDLRKLEVRCLGQLRDFAAGSDGPAHGLVDDLVHYDELIAGERTGTRRRIERTLADRPWQACPCEICQRWGVEVIVFRGNNRNRRRGFHNTFTFYRLLESVAEGHEIRLGRAGDRENSAQLNLFNPAKAVGS